MAGTKTPNTPARLSNSYDPNGKQKAALPVHLYAVQCEECFKWRLISTQEEYEDIRSKVIEKPFTCHRKFNRSCGDPSDIECDASRTWVIDKPNIPKPPEGFQRTLTLRRNYSKLDASYITPTGKRVRSHTELASFVEANPKYKDLPLSSFSFTVPKIMEETLPENVLKEGFGSSSNKKIKRSKDESVS